MVLAKHSGGSYLLLSVLVIVIDRLTKLWCVDNISYGTMGIEVLPFFNLVHVYNYGAAFSFLASMGGWQRWFFAATAGVLTLVFLVWLLRTPRSRKMTCCALALFIGGALGNLIDRLLLGYVVDFLLFYIKTDEIFWAYPAFNVADIAVCTGAFLLVFEVLFCSKGKA